MKAILLSARASLLGLFLLGVACGCGSSVKLVPVSGKITVDGQPLTGGQVSLVPLAEPTESKTAGLSTGNIDSSGQYKIMTNGKEGAPTGKYKVVVAPGMVPAADTTKPPSPPFAERYMNPRDTDLNIEVVASPSPGQYDLKLAK